MLCHFLKAKKEEPGMAVHTQRIAAFPLLQSSILMSQILPQAQHNGAN